MRGFAAALLFLIAAPLSAANAPYLVKDINTGVFVYYSSDPSGFTSVGGSVYFWTYQPGELWRTDGTESGTWAVPNVPRQPFKRASQTSQVAFHGELFFTAADTAHGLELWKTDGIHSDVLDIVPGQASSSPSSLTVVGDHLLFSSLQGLRITDGSVEGTHLVADRNGESFNSWQIVGATSEYALFIDGSYKIYRTDGTTTGTRKILDARDERIVTAVHIGDTTYFIGGQSIYRIGRSDDQATRITPASLRVFELVALGDTLILSGVDEQQAYRFWRSDGTPEGTLRIPADVRLPAGLTVLGPYVYFAGPSPDPQSRQLWRTDGTAAGTRALGTTFYVSPGEELGRFGAVVDGQALMILHGDLVRSDGNTSSRVPMPSSPSSTFWLQSKDFAVLNGNIILTGCGTNGCEPWKTDGTKEGTRQLADIVPGASTWSSSPRQFTPALGQLFFIADTDARSIWKSDGTGAGTQRIKDFDSGSGDQIFGECGGQVYFFASRQHQLWRTDGTASGTAQIEIGDSYANMIIPATACVNETLYFFVTGLTGGGGLAYTQGTNATTGYAARGFSDYPLIAWRDRLFFGAPYIEGRSLWSMDPRTGQLELVSTAPEGPRSFVGSTSNALFFIASGESVLCATDGTLAGTVPLLPIRSDRFKFLSVIDEILYFIGPEKPDGAEANTLWKSDGTPGGTSIVKTFAGTLEPQIASFNGALYVVVSNKDASANARYQLTRLQPQLDGIALTIVASRSDAPRELTAFANRLYFANPGLWATDGTAEGTFAVRPQPSSNLTVAGSRLLFAADDDRFGTELWAIDAVDKRTRAASHH